MEADDWRMCNGGAHLQGLTLVHLVWRQTVPGWDHDHCELCADKIADERQPDALREAYATEDERKWFCATCFNDFREFYGWTLRAPG